MESEPDSKFTDYDITQSVVSFARTNPNGWFAASHIASQLHLSVNTVRQALVKLTEELGWLKAFVDYECPDHDFTLARKPFGELVGRDEVITCTGDEEGHEVSLAPEHATVVFVPAEPLVQYAKKA